MSRLTPPVGPDDHVQGARDARVTVLEYGDFECPHCGAAYPLVKEIERTLGAKLLIAYRHFPLTRIHPHAAHAADISEAVAQHGKFWPMHDILFENQGALDDDHLIAYAESLGIDPKWAETALGDGRFEQRVREDFSSGVRSGVNGTPTFFINGARYDGDWGALLEILTEATIDAPLHPGG
jgi:protein-disulfide isomerase